MRLLSLIPTSLRHSLLTALLRNERERIIIPDVRWMVEMWNGSFEEDIPSAVLRADPKRYGKPEIHRTTGEGILLWNGVTNAGEDALRNRLVGTSPTAFDASNAYLGVGDSSTAFAESQTDLQAATNKVRVGMNATYPKDGSGAQTTDWQSDFTSGVGNFAWAEWALFNASSSGTMFSRKVESLGTKASGSVWTLTGTFDFSSV